MIESSHSEEYLLRSVKKFFLDTFKDPNFIDIPLFFDLVDRPPTVNAVEAIEWMCVLHKATDTDTLSQAFFQIVLFSKGDTDGLQLAIFRDKIVGLLTDFDQTDARLRLPIYNSNWDLVHYAVLGLKDDLGTVTLDEGLKIKIIPFTLFWGAK